MVSGGASGIDRAAALPFAQEGASVVSDVAVECGEETVSLVEGEGGKVSFVKAEVSDPPGEVEAMIARTVKATPEWATPSIGWASRTHGDQRRRLFR